MSTRKFPQRLDWIVYCVGGAKARQPGTVRVATMEAAITTAVAEFGVPAASAIGHPGQGYAGMPDVTPRAQDATPRNG